MKKILFMTAAATAMLFTACTNSDDVALNDRVINENAPQPVEFGTYLGKTDVTRAAAYVGGTITNGDPATDANALKNVGFGVFAYHTGTTAWGSWTRVAPNFMYNQQVNWNATTPTAWVYSPVKYWPNGIDAMDGGTNDPSNTATQATEQKVSFFAYAPYYATTGDYSGSDLPTTPATVSAAVTTGNTNGIVAMSKNTETTDIQLKYVLETSASEKTAVDMLWGLRGDATYTETDNVNNAITDLGNVYNTDLTKQIVNNEKVKFLFKHALARVGGSTSSEKAVGNQICGLKVVVDVDANSTTAGAGLDNQATYLNSSFDNQTTLVTIKSVKIRDIGTYARETDATSTTKSDFQNWGWFDIMTGAWTNTGTTTDANIAYNVSSDNTATDATVSAGTNFKLNADIMEPTSVTVSNISSSKWAINGTTGVTTTAKNVYADGQEVPGLLLIPGTTGSNTLYVTVDYIVRTVDGNLSTGYTEVEQTITNLVTLNNTILNPNKQYTLVMHLGLTSVKFEAVVADWSLTDGTYTDGGQENNGSGDHTTSVWLPSNVVE